MKQLRISQITRTNKSHICIVAGIRIFTYAHQFNAKRCVQYSRILKNQQSRSQIIPTKDRIVNVYDTYRSYGGAEEGGWYYTAKQCVLSKRCANNRHANYIAGKLIEKYPYNEGFSVDVENRVSQTDINRIGRPYYC